MDELYSHAAEVDKIIVWIDGVDNELDEIVDRNIENVNDVRRQSSEFKVFVKKILVQRTAIENRIVNCQRKLREAQRLFKRDDVILEESDLNDSQVIENVSSIPSAFDELCQSMSNPASITNIYSIESESGNGRYLILGKLTEDIRNANVKLLTTWNSFFNKVQTSEQIIDDILQNAIEFFDLISKMDSLTFSLLNETKKWENITGLSPRRLAEELERIRKFREKLKTVDDLQIKLYEITEQVDLSEKSEEQVTQLVKKRDQLYLQYTTRYEALNSRCKEKNHYKFLLYAAKQPLIRQLLPSGLPYYVNVKTHTEFKFHPYFEKLLDKLSTKFTDVRYPIYKIALKLRYLQKQLKFDHVDNENLNSILDSLDANSNLSAINMIQTIIDIFKVDGSVNIEENALLIDMVLNWTLLVLDKDKSGNVKTRDFIIFMTSMSNLSINNKIKRLFWTAAGENEHYLTKENLNNLLMSLLNIPIGILEIFPKETYHQDIEDCLKKADRDLGISPEAFEKWLLYAPQSVEWLICLDKIYLSENLTHQVKCNICKLYPIRGIRFRCLQCFNFDICQTCFLRGVHNISHPYEELSRNTRPLENITGLPTILRNKIKRIRVKDTLLRKKNSKTLINGGSSTQSSATTSEDSLSIKNPIKIIRDCNSKLEEIEEHLIISRMCDSINANESTNSDLHLKQLSSLKDDNERLQLELIDVRQLLKTTEIEKAELIKELAGMKHRLCIVEKNFKDLEVFHSMQKHSTTISECSSIDALEVVNELIGKLISNTVELSSGFDTSGQPSKESSYQETLESFVEDFVQNQIREGIWMEYRKFLRHDSGYVTDHHLTPSDQA